MKREISRMKRLDRSEHVIHTINRRSPSANEKSALRRRKASILFRMRIFHFGTLSAGFIFHTVSGQSISSYQALTSRIHSCQAEFAKEYSQGGTSRAATIDKARSYLVQVITDSILPAWYGTPWDFNGATRTPGQGTIACGYFVNTVLQDAGFRIPRIKWSQLAAEPMILKLAPASKRFSDVDVPVVETWLRTQGDGVYAVGLDNHVGFITVRRWVLRFVHSNYYQRDIGVMSEPLPGINPFAASRYRVIGKLFDDRMIMAWLNGSPYA